MYALVFDFRSELGAEDLDLCQLPFQLAREQADAEALAAFEVLDEVVFRDLLELFAFGPGVERDLEQVFFDVDEPGFFEPWFVFVVSGYWPAVF